MLPVLSVKSNVIVSKVIISIITRVLSVISIVIISHPKYCRSVILVVAPNSGIVFDI